MLCSTLLLQAAPAPVINSHAPYQVFRRKDYHHADMQVRRARSSYEASCFEVTF